MTAAHDPAECARLVLAASDVAGEPIETAEQQAIVRGMLLDLADQLEAACAEVERLTALIDENRSEAGAFIETMRADRQAQLDAISDALHRAGVGDAPVLVDRIALAGEELARLRREIMDGRRATDERDSMRRQLEAAQADAGRWKEIALAQEALKESAKLEASNNGRFALENATERDIRCREVAELTAKLEQAQRAYRDDTTMHLATESDLAHNRRRADAAEAQVADLTAKLESAGVDLSHAKLSHDRATGGAADLRSKLANVNARWTTIDQERHDARKALGAADTETLAQAAERVIRERQGYARDHRDSVEDESKLAADLAAAQQRIAELEAIVAGDPVALGALLKAKDGQRDALKARVAELEEDLELTPDAVLITERNDALAILRAIWPVWLAADGAAHNARNAIPNTQCLCRLCATVDTARAALTSDLLAALKAAGLEVDRG